MSTPLRLDYAVNDADVIAAFKRQQAEMEKERKARQELEKQINSNSSAQKAADKAAADSAKNLATEQQKLSAAASKIAEAVRTPLQTYKAGLTELRDHLKAGRLEQDQYRAAVDKLKGTYNDVTGKTKAAKDAEVAHTAAVKEATAIAEKYATKEEKVAASIKKLNDLKAKGVLTSKDHARAVTAETAKLSETGEAAESSGGLVGGLTSKMAGFVGGLGLATAVISTIKAEYDALIERQGKSRDANLSLAVEQEALLMNLGDAKAEDVGKQIRELSQKTGVKEENVTRAVNEAMAARADLSVEDVIAGVETASKVRKFAPSEMASLAGATIDTQKQTGLGTDESLGFLMQLQAQSRTKSLKGVAENFTPAVGGVMNFGADRQTAGAILASLSHGMGDVTGAQTGTSGIQLAKQLRQFSGGKDIGETIAQLQANPEMRAEFLKTASFEAKALPAVESLLSGGTQAAQYASAKAALGKDPLETLNKSIADRGEMSSIGLAERNQSMANIVDQQRLGDTSGAESAIARDQLKDFRQQSGRWGSTSKIQAAIEDVRTGGKQTTEQTLETMESELAVLKQGKTDNTAFLRGLLGASASPIVSVQEGRNRNDAESQAMIKQMEELVALTRQQLDVQKNAAHAGVVAGRANQREGAN